MIAQTTAEFVLNIQRTPVRSHGMMEVIDKSRTDLREPTGLPRPSNLLTARRNRSISGGDVAGSHHLRSKKKCLVSHKKWSRLTRCQDLKGSHQLFLFDTINCFSFDTRGMSRYIPRNIISEPFPSTAILWGDILSADHQMYPSITLTR